MIVIVNNIENDTVLCQAYNQILSFFCVDLNQQRAIFSQDNNAIIPSSAEFRAYTETQLEIWKSSKILRFFSSFCGSKPPISYPAPHPGKTKGQDQGEHLGAKSQNRLFLPKWPSQEQAQIRRRVGCWTQCTRFCTLLANLKILVCARARPMQYYFLLSV